MDDLAAVTLLAGENVAVKLITTTCGICRPGTGFDSMQRIVNAAGLKTRVVAGAEDRRPVPHGAWEFGQHSLLAALCSTLGPPGPFQRPSADAAADAILHTLREEESGTVTILSMGGMTNLGLAARRDPATFKKVQRIVFVGGVRGPPGYHQRPYNAWLDPDALRHVINSGVQLVLIGKGCYASLAWCLDLVEGTDLPAESAPERARLLWRILQADPEQAAYDPLAAFFLVQPEAFRQLGSVTSVRVTDGAGWRFEQCAPTDAGAGSAVEYDAIDLHAYRKWLSRAMWDDP